MNALRYSIGFAVASAAFLIAIAHSQPVTQNPNAPTIPGLEGFTITEIRFDESMGDKRLTPKVPKSWQFVGVSNGEKVNDNNLWFRDAAGNIYMLHGFAEGSKFIVASDVHELHVGN